MRNYQKITKYEFDLDSEIFQKELEFWGLKLEISGIEQSLKDFFEKKPEVGPEMLEKWQPLDIVKLLREEKIGL